MNSYRIGVDIGGTSMDLVMMNESTGELQLVPSSKASGDWIDYLQASDG